MLAKFPGVCRRCDEPIVVNVHEVVSRPSGPIHVGCASGADDAPAVEPTVRPRRRGRRG